MSSNKNKTNTSIIYSPIVEIKSENIKSNVNVWDRIYLYLGVISNDVVENSTIRRILVVRIVPFVTTSTIVNSIVITTSTTNQSKKQHRNSLVDFISNFMNSLCNNIKSISNREISTSLVDVGFIRDLQSAYGQNMILHLTDEFKKVDSKIKLEELKCAKLMTLIKPIYVRYNIII